MDRHQHVGITEQVSLKTGEKHSISLPSTSSVWNVSARVLATAERAWVPALVLAGGSAPQPQARLLQPLYLTACTSGTLSIHSFSPRPSHSQCASPFLQTCMGKDVTLHVSASNPAMLLYQKFGFKTEEYVLDFYDKYYPLESTECKHAFFLRLRR